MFHLNSSNTAAFGSLLLSVFMWGMWPHIRAKSGYCVPQFILLNIPSQAVTALFLAFTLGNIKAFNNFFDERSFGQEFKYGIDNFGSREVALLAGGFVLGFGDHIGAIAMAFMNPGAAYCIYGGIILTLGCVLNYMIDGSEKPGLLFTGIFIGLAGLLVLGWSQSEYEKEEKIRLTQGNVNAYSRLEDGLYDTQKELTMSVHKAMGLCVFAGLFAMLWSPLSTYARANDMTHLEGPYVTQVIFVIGELFSIPVVRKVSNYIIALPEEPYETGRVMWGCVCGFCVGLGYFGYYLGSTNFSKTASFGIVCCNSIVAISIDVLIMKKYQHSSPKVKYLVFLSILLYLSCVIVLSQTL